VPRDIARHFAAASGVADVDSILEIKGFHEFGNVGSVCVHVVATRRLRGTAVPASIMGDHPVTVPQKEHHLGVPIVGGKGPAMVEEERLTRAPILVENLGAVLGCDRRHILDPFLIGS
jgi:hypothetical protein